MHHGVLGFSESYTLTKKNTKPSSGPVGSAYRSPLEVVVQSLVQQRPLAAPLGAHQRDVDVVVRPCKPLVSSGDGHRVRGHGGRKMGLGNEEMSRRANLSQPDFLLKALATMSKPNFFCLAPVAMQRRLTYACA